MRWYRLAAEQGDATAQSNLGVMYGNGRGVLKNEAEAVRWYRLAAEQGDATAQFNLGFMYAGLMYAVGEGVLNPRIPCLRTMWSNIAGANGNARASEVAGYS